LNIFHMMFQKNQVLITRMAGFLPVFSVLQKVSWMKNLRAIECGYQWQTPNINLVYTFSTYRDEIQRTDIILLHSIPSFLTMNCSVNTPLCIYFALLIHPPLYSIISHPSSSFSYFLPFSSNRLTINYLDSL